MLKRLHGFKVHARALASYGNTPEITRDTQRGKTLKVSHCLFLLYYLLLLLIVRAYCAHGRLFRGLNICMSITGRVLSSSTVPIMHDNILIVIASFAVFLIMLILASPTQWRVRNTGTILNIGWLLAGNLTFLVNAVIWRDNVVNSAPVWCDICKHVVPQSRRVH